MYQLTEMFSQLDILPFLWQIVKVKTGGMLTKVLQRLPCVANWVFVFLQNLPWPSMWWYMEVGLWEIIRVRWNHEGRSLVSWVMKVWWALIQRHQRASLFPLPCEDTARSPFLQAKRGLPPDPDLAGTLISDFEPPELWERRFLLFKYPVYGMSL